MSPWTFSVVALARRSALAWNLSSTTTHPASKGWVSCFRKHRCTARPIIRPPANQQSGESKMSTEAVTPHIPRINEPAPQFEAKSTHGIIKLSDYTSKGKWVLLFSHPADFTPVCTTEFIEFARNHDQFEKHNVQLIGNSVDSVYSHIAWVRNIEENFGVQVKFPVIADLDQKVAKSFGMVHEAVSDTATVRAVFFIDPKGVIRALLYYPLSLGRNVDEILRVFEALQT